MYNNSIFLERGFILKINISLDDELVGRIDNCAEANYMSRSGLISFATTQYLNQADMIVLLKDMSLAMRKIADNGTIDSDTMQQLEDFERMCKMIVGQK